MELQQMLDQKWDKVSKEINAFAEEVEKYYINAFKKDKSNFAEFRYKLRGFVKDKRDMRLFVGLYFNGRNVFAVTTNGRKYKLNRLEHSMIGDILDVTLLW